MVQSQLPSHCHVTLPTVPEMKMEEQPEKYYFYNFFKWRGEFCFRSKIIHIKYDTNGKFQAIFENHK